MERIFQVKISPSIAFRRICHARVIRVRVDWRQPAWRSLNPSRLAQQPPPRVWVYNSDESKVAPYTLPDPLVLQNGKPVRDAATWFQQRRPEILHIFETQVYGRTPAKRLPIRFAVTSVDRNALGGIAIRKQITAYFTDKPDGPEDANSSLCSREGQETSASFRCVELRWKPNR